MKLDRRNVVIAALAGANGDPYTPVQLQKMMFMLDKNLPSAIGGPFFDFQPYDYGAFDATVYQVAKELSLSGFVLIDSNPGTPVRTYAPTSKGMNLGTQVLESLAPELKRYVVELSAWIRSMTFAELVSAMYELHPDTKANSVFKG